MTARARALWWLLAMAAITAAAEAAVQALAARSHSISYPALHVNLAVLLRMPIPVTNKVDNGWTILAVVWVWLGLLAYCGYRFATLVRGFWPLAGGFAAVCVLAAAFPVFLSADPYAYVTYGRLYGLHGINPYALPLPLPPSLDAAIAQCLTIYGNPPPGDNYGPAWTLLAAALSKISAAWPLAKLAIAQRVVALLFAVAMLGALARLGRKKDLSLGRCAFHPLLVFETAVGAHNDIIMLACAAWAFAVVDDLPLLAGLLIGASIAVKYVSVAALPFLVIKAWRRRRSRAIALCAVAALVVVLCWLPFYIGPATWASLVAHSARVSMSPTWFVSAVLGLFAGSRTQADLGRLAQVIVALCFCVAYGWALWRFARGRGAGHFWAAVAALLWAAPMLNPWYALWLIPAVGESGAVGIFAWWFCALAVLRYAGEVPIYPPVWVLAAVTIAIFAGPLAAVWILRRRAPSPAV